VAAGVAVLCALPAVVAALPVPGSPLTASQLRARIMASAGRPYQGYAESDMNLDVPQLPDLASVIGLLDGVTDQYAWYRAPGHWRSDVLQAASEQDTYQVGRDTYAWDYSRGLLTRITGAQPVRLPRAADLLPPVLARRLLGFASPADRISRLGSQRVAGVAAAGLRLVPAQRATTIAAVDIWADPVTGLPVQVEVFGRAGPGEPAGSSGRVTAAPVLTSRFLDLTERRPALSTVTPDPAPGVGMTTARLPDVSGILNAFAPPLPGVLAGRGRVAVPAGLSDVAAYGSGFDRFAVLPLPAGTGARALSVALAAGAQVQLAGGTGVLVSTPLLNVVLARPSYGGPVYLLTGAVTAALLERAAAGLMASVGSG
jgi:hypothetical protein